MNQNLPPNPSDESTSSSPASAAAVCTGSRCGPVITKVREILDTPIPHQHRVQKIARIIGLILFSVLVCFGLSRMMAEQMLWRLNMEKAEASTSVDTTTTFGRVIINSSNQIVSWNKGMSVLTGYKSAEMRNHKLSKLRGWGADPGAIDRVGSIRPYPWLADGTVDILTKEGDKLTLSVTIRDTAGPDGQVKFRYIFFDQLWMISGIHNGHSESLSKRPFPDHNHPIPDDGTVKPND